jgi:hypothetical protein
MMRVSRPCNRGGGVLDGAMARVADPIAAPACKRLFPGHRVRIRQLSLDFVHESRTGMDPSCHPGA